jgi:flavin reductase
MNQTPTIAELSREEFTSAMARAVNGVAVVATDGPGGRVGITVSSVSSVSADPPLVLACVNRKSRAHGALSENGAFSVNLLSADQQDLAQAFAGQPSSRQPYEFVDGEWDLGSSGAPVLVEAVATFACVLEQAHDAGSHTIFVGRVTGVSAGPGDPLLYTARAYGRPIRWTAHRGAASTGSPRRRQTAA